MPSTFAWLDYSEQERRRALDVISAFHVRDTRDELGIASVRDAIAEALSPGTTTIQTRARYFLFVPWIYLDLEDKRVGSDRMAARARRAEEQLIPELAQAADPGGTIGIEAGRRVQRMPSNIYWAGLRRWGILLFEGSQDQYHRSMDRSLDRVRRHRQREHEREDPGPRPVNWHPHIPEPPDDFPAGASFELRPEEAEYLRERILSVAQGTLLAHLADRGRRWDTVELPWDHPWFGEFPERIRWELEHARQFSELVHGAALLYNLMLAEAIERQDWIEDYEQAFGDWAALVEGRSRGVGAWDREEFWSWMRGLNPRIPPPTRHFVDRWADLVTGTDDGAGLAAHPAPRNLVRDREAFLKRDRARLQNRRHLELWSGASGTGRLDFRWGITQTLLLDIIAGLPRSPSEQPETPTL